MGSQGLTKPTAGTRRGLATQKSNSQGADRDKSEGTNIPGCTPMCIEDNACFCCGVGHTLVRLNYAQVTCTVYSKNFRFVALLGILLDL